MSSFILIGLFLILIAVLIFPFCSKRIEQNIEVFLFLMGIAAACVGKQMSWHLGLEAIREPIPITGAVLCFGALFKWFRKELDRAVGWVLARLSLTSFVFLLIVFLGGIASIITAIIASLILVEIISQLHLDKKHETRIVILTCFSIGLGAALTPIGEPLSTIALAKLKSWPEVNFWFLAKMLGSLVTIGIFMLALLSLFFRGHSSRRGLTAGHREESYREIFIRTGRVYLFVVALVFLGEGFKPVIDAYVIRLSADALYWINSISAVLDNATLTAAEISPAMNAMQIKKILIGLLIAGGMLIPGNIPNIITASKLKIASKDWARFGVPVGFSLMAIFFVLLRVVE